MFTLTGTENQKLTQYVQDRVWDSEDVSLAVDCLARVRAFVVRAHLSDGDLSTPDSTTVSIGPPRRAALLVSTVADPRRVADVTEVASPHDERRRDATRLTADDSGITVFHGLFARGSHCNCRRS